MISEDDRLKILEIAKKYNASRVFLFGSCVDHQKEANDIDLAVEGVPDSKFFKFYSELIFSLSKPVDLIDLKRKSRLNDLVVSEGVILYG